MIIFKKKDKEKMRYIVSHKILDMFEFSAIHDGDCLKNQYFIDNYIKLLEYNNKVQKEIEKYDNR